MSGYQEIVQQLDKLPRWQLTVFSAACADRVAPVFRILASRSSVVVFNDILERVWMSTIDGAPLRVSKKLRRLPEARAEDSKFPEYYAMQALSVLNDGVDAIESDARAAARSACEGALNLISNVDWRLNPPGEYRVVNPRHPPPPGPLESQELLSQQETLTQLGSAHELDDTILRSIRGHSSHQHDRLESAVQQLARAAGWL